MSTELMSLKATNGTITAFDDRVVIQRKGAFAIASQGIVGDRVFYYKDLSSVEYKKPGMINGYLKFITAGTIASNASVNAAQIKQLFTTDKKITEDENTVLLRAFDRKTPQLADDMYKLILDRMSACKSQQPIINTSVADELLKLKTLLDCGAITQTEFDVQKAKILK